MSLRVWLPLNGTLENKGLDNVTVTNSGATVNNNGKIGKCYSFDGINDYIISSGSPFTNSTDNWSYACWFKPVNQHTGCLFSDRTIVDTTGISIFYYNTAIYFDDGTRWQFTPSTAITVGDWNHLVFIRKKGIGKYFYLNGVLVNSTTATGTQSTVGTNFSIGNSQISNTSASGNPLNGYLNDIRLYDHALSPLEVKQISQGLILHYPLNRNGWGQENLIAGTDFNGSSKKYTLTSGTEGGFSYTPTETILANTEYTVSCQLRGNANMNLYKICTGGNESIGWVNRSQLSTTEYKFFSITFTYPSSKTLNQIYICTRYGALNSSTGDWFEIKPNSLKLEKGSIPTPWCPNSSDALATTMGLNNNVEYDTSGYGNNGTKTGTFNWTSDTPKYNVSTEFNGSNTCIYLNNFVLGNEWSYGMWFYHPTRDGTWTIITILNNTGSDSDTQFSFWYNNNENRFQSTANTQYNASIPTPTKDAWHHFFATFDGNILTTYIDGVVVNTKTITAELTQKPHLTIGGRRSGENSWNYYWKGKMSDYRVYCTALSADDVKSLYQNSAYIDNQGNIYGAVYEEV